MALHNTYSVYKIWYDESQIGDSRIHPICGWTPWALSRIIRATDGHHTELVSEEILQHFGTHDEALRAGERISLRARAELIDVDPHKPVPYRSCNG